VEKDGVEVGSALVADSDGGREVLEAIAGDRHPFSNAGMYRTP
jgi:hypothetical protein